MGNFRPWIDNPTTGVNGNILSSADFISSLERANGFQSGTVISAKSVNSALRQANLVVTALMETIAPNYQSGSLESSVNQIKFAFSTYFDPLIGSVTYDDGTHTLTVVHRNGATETYTIDVSSGTVEAAVKDGAGNVITETYATKSELNEQASWCDEYDPEEPYVNALMADSWSDYSPGASGNIENVIVANSHDFSENDNVIISIDKSATKAQCEAFYDALLVPVGIDMELGALIVKALGDIPSVDIPVTVMRV